MVFEKTKTYKIMGELCDFTYLTPYIDGDDYGGNNFIIRIVSKKLPQILTEEQRNKLRYHLNDNENQSEFVWFYYTSYDNCDYNGAFLETLFIDKNDEFTIENINEELDWLIDGDYLSSIEKCLGMLLKND